jgi:uncharacterized phage-associated protein
MMYPVDEIADSIIALCGDRGMKLTNLKLQKLLYYVQAWKLAFDHEPLFAEDVEAWVHGPVVPRVFRRFKSLRWEPLPPQGNPITDEKVTSHLKAVLTQYDKFSAGQLEQLTHNEPPWLEARIGLEPDEPSNRVIPKARIEAYYGSRLVNAR